MGRLKTWRYDPPVTWEERHALRSELLAMWLIVVVLGIVACAEPLMDWFMRVLGG